MPTPPGISLTARAAARTAETVRRVLDAPVDLSGNRSRRRSYNERGFWALITCHYPFQANRWKYGFVEVMRTGDTFIKRPNGRSADPCCKPAMDGSSPPSCGAYALNSIEMFNGIVGIMGNSTDTTRSRHGEKRYILPVDGFPVVWMDQVIEKTNDGKRVPRYTFAYENDWADTDYGKPPPGNTCCPHNPYDHGTYDGPCCPCFTIKWTLDPNVPPIILKAAGGDTWTSEDDTSYIIGDGAGNWTLQISGDGTTATYTATGPCPPTTPDGWTLASGSLALASLECNCDTPPSPDCCNCYQVAYTADTTASPYTLNSTGANSWGDGSGTTITGDGAGNWTLTYADGTTYTATGDCPPEDASLWTLTSGNTALLKIQCCETPCDQIRDVRFNTSNHCLEKTTDCQTWTTVVCFSPCGGS